MISVDLAAFAGNGPRALKPGINQFGTPIPPNDSVLSGNLKRAF
jgi:hypothetical protein